MQRVEDGANRRHSPLYDKRMSWELPGKIEKPPRTLEAHKVVSQVEVGDILAVKEIFRHHFQAVAGQVNHANGL